MLYLAAKARSILIVPLDKFAPFILHGVNDSQSFLKPLICKLLLSCPMLALAGELINLGSQARDLLGVALLLDLQIFRVFLLSLPGRQSMFLSASIPCQSSSL
jgi:hypothetical protein